MRQTFIALLGIVIFGCNADVSDHEPIPEPSSSRQLVIEQRSLTGDTALTAVGLRPVGADRADAQWGYRCDYSKAIRLEDSWKQRFRVTIQNFSREALEFEVEVTQHSGEGEAPPRTRDLGRLVVPPLTEKRFSGFMLRPFKPAEKTCEVELVEPGR